MKNKFNLILLGMVVAILAASSAYAESISIEEISPSSVQKTKGDTFYVDVTYTPSGLSGNCELGIRGSSLPSNWQTESPKSVDCNSSSTASSPKISVNTKDSGDIRVYIESSSGTYSATDTFSAVSKEGSILSPSLVSSSSIDVSSGNSYEIEMNVENSGDLDSDGANAQVNCPSGYSGDCGNTRTLTGTGQSDGVITTGNTVYESFTITADDPTSGNVSIEVGAANSAVTNSVSVETNVVTVLVPSLISDSSINVNSGESYEIEMDVENNANIDTEGAEAQIYCPSGYSGDCGVTRTLTETGQSDGVITRGDTINETFNITADDPTSGNVSIEVGAANSAVTNSVDVALNTEEDGGGTGGGGGGGGGTGDVATNDTSQNTSDVSQPVVPTPTEQAEDKSNTYSPNPEQVSNGYTKTLGVDDKIEFSKEDSTHSLTVDDVKENSVTIEIASEPQQATLSVGETKKFNLVNDDYYDLSVTLHAINDNNEAGFTIKSIHEKLDGVDKEDKEKTGNQSSEGMDKVKETVKENKEETMIISFFVVLVVLGLIIYYVVKRKHTYF